MLAAATTPCLEITSGALDKPALSTARKTETIHHGSKHSRQSCGRLQAASVVLSRAPSQCTQGTPWFRILAEDAYKREEAEKNE